MYKVSACTADREAFYMRPDPRLEVTRGQRTTRQAKVREGEVTVWRLLQWQGYGIECSYLDKLRICRIIP